MDSQTISVIATAAAVLRQLILQRLHPVSQLLNPCDQAVDQLDDGLLFSQVNRVDTSWVGKRSNVIVRILPGVH